MPKVLVVEENQKIADLISAFLQKKGFQTDSVGDGVNAIRSFVGNAYDLLLVDIDLPFMSGVNVCKKIRASEKGRTIPIVMVSMSERPQTELGSLVRELSLNGVLARPFTYEALFSMISSSLQTSAPSSSSLGPSAGQQPAMKADLGTTRFEKVLFYLMKKKGTGTLVLSRDQAVRKFHFIDGGPVELETAGEEHFGGYLAHRNLADPGELQAYEKIRQRDRSDPRELFVKMGCLTPERFLAENRNFLEEKLVDCFGWSSGSLVFQWQPSFLKTFSSASAVMPVLFYRGFKACLPASELSDFMEKRADRYIDKTGEWYELQNHLAPEIAAVEVLDQIDGSRTVAEIAVISDAEDTAVILYTLDYLKLVSFAESPVSLPVQPAFPVRKRSTRQQKQEADAFVDLGGELSDLADEVAAIGAINPSPAPVGDAADQAALEDDLKAQWEAIRGKNYYEIFGMTRVSFTFEKLKKSYFQFTKVYGPDRFFASSSEIMSLAEEFLSKISNAYETLTNVVSKENYDEMLSSQEQMPTREGEKEFYEQIQFQSGKVFVEQGQYESAEKAFTNCLNIDPKKSEYLAYLALAIYNNPANRTSPAAIKRAKDAVNKSLQMGKLAIAYALKGTMYLDEGSLNFAEAEFNKALKLNPGNKTALKSLEVIRQRRDEEKKGLFQRMFK